MKIKPWLESQIKFHDESPWRADPVVREHVENLKIWVQALDHLKVDLDAFDGGEHLGNTVFVSASDLRSLVGG